MSKFVYGTSIFGTDDGGMADDVGDWAAKRACEPKITRNI